MRKNTLFFSLAIAAASGILVHLADKPMHETPAGSATAKSSKHQLWTCAMHPQVVQDKPGKCPICHMELEPLGAGHHHAENGPRRVKYWTDPMMNPPFISDQPGKSPMGMDLTPVYE